jgi:hypothetical protein
MKTYYNICVLMTATFLGMFIAGMGAGGAGFFTFLFVVIIGVVLQKREKKFIKAEMNRLELLYTIKQQKEVK